ncbi:nuclear transport factor 2 family protein [Subtercola endophyticus]|uniref:nuclear transport factor 2 family protein n=1 Tax=Subtercola endophyticus TaxID=2895559 RepID=UPI001E490B23|nr:nuclear transport factor 2 family protein [Subtercola endophyticus]UFS59131.1 nuclear transport factor 2 family protein [Subtercola endophyticus]
MTSSTSLLATDRLDITALLARHSYAVDHQNEALLRETVAADARIETLLDARAPAVGVDGLVALVALVTAPAPGITRETVFRNPLVSVDGGNATVVSELGLVELELLADGGAVRRQYDATSVDRLVRTPDGWRLAERRLHLADVDVASVAVPADRRALIEQGAGILTAAEFLGSSTDGTSTSGGTTGAGGAPGTSDASELLDVEAALAFAAFERDREATVAAGTSAATGTGTLSSRHLVSNVKVVVDGDRAQAESEFVRTTLTQAASGATSDTATGVTRRRTSGVELTELERSPDGWVISTRTEYLKSDARSSAELDETVRQAIAVGTRALGELVVPHPLALGEVTDARLAIREVLIRYSSVFDQERWGLIGEVFAPDAAFGDEPAGSGASSFVDGARAFYHDRLTGLHSIAEPVLRVDGDHAWAYTDFTTIAIHEPADGADDHLDRLRSGGFYVDELTRGESGWRVSRRAVAYSSSVRDTIDGGRELRPQIARTKAQFGAYSPAV